MQLKLKFNNAAEKTEFDGASTVQKTLLLMSACVNLASSMGIPRDDIFMGAIAFGTHIAKRITEPPKPDPIKPLIEFKVP